MMNGIHAMVHEAMKLPLDDGMLGQHNSLENQKKLILEAKLVVGPGGILVTIDIDLRETYDVAHQETLGM